MSTEPYDGYSIHPTTARQFRDRILRGMEPAVVTFVSGGFATRQNLGWGHGKIVVTNDEHVNVAFTRQDAFRTMVRGLEELNYTVRTSPCSIGYALAVMDEGEGRQQRAFVWITSKIARWLDEAAKESFTARSRILGINRGHQRR
jgi:hypothetical protein